MTACEKHEDIQLIFWSSTWKKNRQYNNQRTRTKRQTIIYKSLHN
jgi:hypothetical protein